MVSLNVSVALNSEHWRIQSLSLPDTFPFFFKCKNTLRLLITAFWIEVIVKSHWKKENKDTHTSFQLCQLGMFVKSCFSNVELEISLFFLFIPLSMRSFGEIKKMH